MQVTLEVLRRLSRDLAKLQDHGNIQVIKKDNNLRLSQNGMHISVSYLLPFINYKGKNGVITARHRIEMMNIIEEMIIKFNKSDSQIYVDVNGTVFSVYEIARDYSSKILVGEVDIVPINGFLWRKFLI